MADIYENGGKTEEAAERDAAPKMAEAAEKTFTQDELEKLISERLRRERRNFEAFEDLKGAFDELSSTGVIEKASYSDMARMLGERLGRAKDADEFQIPAEPEKDAVEAEENDTFAKGIGEEPETEDGKADDADKGKAGKSGLSSLDGVTLGDILSLEEEYPGEDAAMTVLSESFRLFAEGRNAPLGDIYEQYIRFERAHGGSEGARRKTVPLRSSFSDGAVQTDYGASLTKRQMEIAREGGLSYREYAEMLGSLPGTGKISL